MQTLVVYASRYGCTADCAAYLKTHLPGDVTLVDIETVTQPLDLEGFDRVAIGGSVYIGKVSKKLRAFCEQNLDLLLRKKVGIFLCCAQTEEASAFLAANFPAALLNHASVSKTFGSEARLDKMGMLDKLMIKAVTKGDFSRFQISTEALEAFVQELSST